MACNPGFEFKSHMHQHSVPEILHLVAIVVYTTDFSTLVLHSSKVVNIILHVPKDAVFILSMSGGDQCRCC